MPHRCVACHDLTQGDFDLCGKCFKSHDFINKPFCNSCGVSFSLNINGQINCNSCQNNKTYFDIGRSLFVFNDSSRKLVHGFKFNDKIHSSKFFAKLFYRKFPELVNEADIISPVPMHRLKRLARLYNPPQILAKSLQEYQSTSKFLPDLLIKSSYTKSQRRLDKNQRLSNLTGSIQLNNKYDITGKKILLVDDVFTTGATINYCSKILKQHKATTVIFFTIART